MTKICTTCNKSKPLSRFTRASRNPDGRRNSCAICYREYQRKYRKTEEGKKQTKLYRERWLKNHPEAAARFKVLRDAWVRGPGKFSQAKHVAKRSGRKWTLSKKLYTELSSKSCNYCAGPLPRTGLGLDRLDNSLHYTPDNVVPCCALCNFARRDQFTVEEMKVFIGPAIAAVRAARSKLAEVSL